MHESYIDITSRIKEEPNWYDENGVPRYGEFTPERCPNIYSNFVVLARIACQDCQREFDVEMHANLWGWKISHKPSKWHYGDPPIHGCVGDTMNCEDLSILQVWRRESFGDWERIENLEGSIDEKNN